MAGRTRTSARKAGSSFERLVADYLKAHVSRYIDRQPKTGNKDKGDLANVEFHILDEVPGRVVVEVKNTARTDLAVWAAEAEAERINADADVGLVVSKRHGRSAPGDQWVHMTLRELAALLSGRRPSE